VLAVEALRAALRQVTASVDDLSRDQPAPRPDPPPKPVASPPQSERARILRPKEVVQLVRLSRVTLWKLQRDGKFPPSRRLSGNAVGWLAEEIEDWIRTRERGL
jgi:predicted DNA-binding transcriptional regulator AlpA